MFGVVGFCPGGWSITAGPAASAVSGGERDALPPSVEPLLAAHIERLAVGVERDSDGAVGAGDALHRFDGHRLVAALEPAVTLAVAECVTRDEHADGRSTQTDHGGRRGVAGNPQQLKEP